MAELDLETAVQKLRDGDRYEGWPLTQRDVDAILAALERIPELEREAAEWESEADDLRTVNGMLGDRNQALVEALRQLREDHGHEVDEHGNVWHPTWCVGCVVDAALGETPDLKAAAELPSKSIAKVATLEETLDRLAELDARYFRFFDGDKVKGGKYESGWHASCIVHDGPRTQVYDARGDSRREAAYGLLVTVRDRDGR